GSCIFSPALSADTEQTGWRWARTRRYRPPPHTRRHFAEHGREESAAVRAEQKPDVAHSAMGAKAQLLPGRGSPGDSEWRETGAVRILACSGRPSETSRAGT